jgi:hypothetical protein
MELKYELDKERLNLLTSKVNRSKNQEQFLFNLVNGDFEKLLQLEMQLYNCFFFYCPGDINDVEKIINMVPKKNYLVLKKSDF